MGGFDCFIHVFELAAIERLLALRPIVTGRFGAGLHSRSKLEHNHSNSNSINPFSRLS